MEGFEENSKQPPAGGNQKEGGGRMTTKVGVAFHLSLVSREARCQGHGHELPLSEQEAAEVSAVVSQLRNSETREADPEPDFWKQMGDLQRKLESGQTLTDQERMLLEGVAAMVRYDG